MAIYVINGCLVDLSSSSDAVDVVNGVLTEFVGSATPTAAVTGTITTSTETDIVTGSKTIILTLTNDTWIAAGTGPVGSTAVTQAIIDGIDSAQAEAAGWDAEVKTILVPADDVVRTSDTVVTITLPAVAAYAITADETITATIPASALTAAAEIVAGNTFTITADSAGTEWTKSLSDTISISDGFADVAEFIRTFPDTITLADNASMISEFLRTFSDSITMSDEITKFFGLVEADIISMADNFSTSEATIYALLNFIAKNKTFNFIAKNKTFNFIAKNKTFNFNAKSRG